ncbi:hypothetical protein [Pelagerythrobacter marensis]|uniref:Uncharacterized protein n=1 Tax=Pelagerythrobacter marensis TaxID=543877 RepID=A0A0G3X4K5_9SPHN|nr:hypothetical protein [Pelagerythrobacter marensis]AKM06117.1 hypothetical protein AM2010_22 [Pelagerythrobacter marensis]
MDFELIEREARLDGEVWLREFAEAKTREARVSAARRALSYLIEAACAKAGPDVLAAAWGESPAETDDRARLECMADRVELFAPPPAAVPQDRLSLLSLASELRAIALGDKPQIVAPAPYHGLKNNNAIRLAKHRLRALQWDAFLEANGNKPFERHNAVSSAYGQDWTTIKAWKAAVVNALGEQELQVAMKVASCRVRHPNRAFPYSTGEEALAALALDGQDFKDEMRRQFVVV